MIVERKTYGKSYDGGDEAFVIFPSLLLATNIFCHTYISLYGFLHIF